jgi:hypothetical protein
MLDEPRDEIPVPDETGDGRFGRWTPLPDELIDGSSKS